MKVSEIDPIPSLDFAKESPKKVEKVPAKPQSQEGFKEILLKEKAARGTGGSGSVPVKPVDMYKRNPVYKKGGSVTMAHRRADGVAKKGFTRGGI